MAIADVIDLLAGIRPGSRLDRIRRERPDARAQSQESWRALFEPVHFGPVSVTERFAVAAFVAALGGEPAARLFYAGTLERLDPELARTVAIVAEAGATTGPYGGYPQGPLSVEDRDGPSFAVPSPHRAALGRRLTAAFEHAHLLVFHPRDAAPASLQKLLDAGWTTPGIVTLSQLVAFLSFQIRVVTGLSALLAADATLAADAARTVEEPA